MANYIFIYVIGPQVTSTGPYRVNTLNYMPINRCAYLNCFNALQALLVSYKQMPKYA